MTVANQIRDEKLQYYINNEASKIFSLFSGKNNKHEYLTGKEILLSYRKQIIEKDEFSYFSWEKAFEKPTKAIKDQRERQVDALSTLKAIKGKKSDDNEKLSKRKEVFEELSNKRISEIQDISEKK